MSFFRNYQKLITGSLIILMIFIVIGCSRNQKPEAAEHNWPTDDTVISLYLHQSGETVELPLREYLYGVVAAEMDVNWPVEALAAQAVMARTFTLEKLEDGGVPERGTDASTNIHEFQAYNADKINERVKQAVDETANQVAVHDGELIKAWFFADGGGCTASSALEGLAYDKEETPYIKSVEDPGASHPDNPNRSWEADFSMKEVAEAVEQVTGSRKESFHTVKIAERGESGRVIRYQFDDITVGAAAFRLAIGGEKLKSALVEEIAFENNRLLVKGKGYGHGVGMSQWGARVLAEEGENAQEIVQYFFDDVEIVQVQP